MNHHHQGANMKQSQKVKSWLEALLIVGLILIIPLFFAIKSRANSLVAPNAPVPPTVVANAPESSIAVKPKQPPACTFPLAQITTAASTPENYTFSEPQVVLTAPKGNIYNIAEWLPDNQQVLMTEDLRNVDVGNDKSIQQSIGLYNPETGETKVIAFRDLTYAPPSWLPDLDAAVYPAITYTSIDRKNGTSKFTRQVLLSYGDPDTVQILVDNLSETSLAIKPDGSEIMYLSDKKISKLDKSLKKLAAPSFDFSQWDYGKGRRDKNPVSYNMAWQPNTSLVFLYSVAGGTANGGYTFILDTNTGQICELDMGGWAGRARWSSDGRYLAIDRSAVYIGFTNSTDLVVLNTITGDLHTTGIVSQDVDGKHYVSDFTWAPDNRHLLVLEDVPSTYDPYRIETIHHELYLVDFTSGQSLKLFPEYKSFAANSDARWNNFAWSPDGSKLLIRCSANRVDRICSIAVQRTVQ
jgi:Tol biopolymer transport system component